MNDVKACSQRKAGNSNHVFFSLGIYRHNFCSQPIRKKKALQIKGTKYIFFQIIPSTNHRKERREADRMKREVRTMESGLSHQNTQGKNKYSGRPSAYTVSSNCTVQFQLAFRDTWTLQKMAVTLKWSPMNLVFMCKEDIWQLRLL